MERLSERPAGVEIIQHGGAEFRHVGPDVAAAKRLAGQDLGIVGRELEPDIERFLEVERLAGIERLVAELDPAAVARWSRKGGALLVFQRQREELLRQREHLAHQLRRNAVTRDVEKSGLAAREPDGARYLL